MIEDGSAIFCSKVFFSLFPNSEGGSLRRMPVYRLIKIQAESERENKCSNEKPFGNNDDRKKKFFFNSSLPRVRFAYRKIANVNAAKLI